MIVNNYVLIFELKTASAVLSLKPISENITNFPNL